MHGSFVPSTREYFRFFGLDHEKLKRAKPDALVMHPGPMNRGVEIDSEVADDLDRTLIREQVEMGVAVRMACLEVLIAAPRALRERRREPQRPAHGPRARSTRLDRLYQRPPGRSHGRRRVPGRGPVVSDGGIADVGPNLCAGRASPDGDRSGRRRGARCWRPAWSTCGSRPASPAPSSKETLESAAPRPRPAASPRWSAARHRAADRRPVAGRVHRAPRPRDPAGQHLRLRRRDPRARGQASWPRSA